MRGTDPGEGDGPPSCPGCGGGAPADKARAWHWPAGPRRLEPPPPLPRASGQAAPTGRPLGLPDSPRPERDPPSSASSPPARSRAQRFSSGPRPPAAGESAPDPPWPGSAGPPCFPLVNPLGSWRLPRPCQRDPLSLAAALSRGQHGWSLWVDGRWRTPDQTARKRGPPSRRRPAAREGPQRSRAMRWPRRRGPAAGAIPPQPPQLPCRPARTPAGGIQSGQKERPPGRQTSPAAWRGALAARGPPWWASGAVPQHQGPRLPPPPPSRLQVHPASGPPAGGARGCDPPLPRAPRGGAGQDSYLVDPASSHMLVSKIKPCMCEYKQNYTVKLRMAH